MPGRRKTNTEENDASQLLRGELTIPPDTHSHELLSEIRGGLDRLAERLEHFTNSITERLTNQSNSEAEGEGEAEPAKGRRRNPAQTPAPTSTVHVVEEDPDDEEFIQDTCPVCHCAFVVSRHVLQFYCPNAECGVLLESDQEEEDETPAEEAGNDGQEPDGDGVELEEVAEGKVETTQRPRRRNPSLIGVLGIGRKR